MSDERKEGIPRIVWILGIVAILVVIVLVVINNGGQAAHSVTDPINADARQTALASNNVGSSAPAEDLTGAQAPATMPAPVAATARPHCTIGAEVFSRENTAEAVRVREAFEDHLADLFCNVPTADPSFHRRPEEIRWTFGDNTPITGEVHTTVGDMRWQPDNR